MDYLYKILGENNNENNNHNTTSNTDYDASLRETESLSAEPFSGKTEIYLKIRPTTSSQVRYNPDSVPYTVEEDGTTLRVRYNNPGDSARRSRRPKSCIKKRFSFTRIFDADVEQSEFFDRSVKPSVIDFLNGGESTTVIGYGTAGSGKTYTLYGETDDDAELGVVPRCIELICSSLSCTRAPRFKPKQFHGPALQLSNADKKRELNAKEKLLACWTPTTSAKKFFKEVEEGCKGNREPFAENHLLYSIWISFIEIYNDTIYDLLDIDDSGRKTQLKLSADKNGATYVQGMRSIHVTSGIETYEILCVGRTRLSTISTSNYKCSRSHSVFIIKLLEYAKDATPFDVKTSSLMFYDLAGPGRVQKSVEDEKQLRESRSINTSLLALGRCFKIISEDHSRQSVGTFRESKLTRLLQHSFRNRDNIILLINLNPATELLAETQSILNFASTAMKLTSQVKEPRRVLSPNNNDTRLESENEVSVRDEALIVNSREQKLFAELAELKTSQLRKEFELRQELTDFHALEMQKQEECWKSRMSALEAEKDGQLKFSVSQVESYYKGKLSKEERHNRNKRKKVDRGDYEEADTVLVSKGSDCQILAKMLSLQELLGRIEKENKHLNAQRDDYASELSLLKKCFKKLNELVMCSNSDVDALKLEDIRKFEASNFDNEVFEYLLNIQNFIKKSLKNSVKHLKSKTQSSGIQCSLDCAVIAEFLAEIQESLDPSFVGLPELDDSLNDSSKEDNFIDWLDKIKNIVFDRVSKSLKLELGNSNVENEIKYLKDKIRLQERELLQMKEQHHESESARVMLLHKLEDGQEKIKLERFIDFQSDNLILLDEDDHTHSIQKSLAESSIEDISRHALSFEKGENFVGTRSSSENSKNDSGLASSSIESASCKSTDDKSSQTPSTNASPVKATMKKDVPFQEQLMQLKLDYKQMKYQHAQESLKVTELSRDLENIMEAMVGLKENDLVMKQIVKDYQQELFAAKLELKRLSDEKRQLEAKCEKLTNNLMDLKREQENQLIESELKLKMHEEGESTASKCLENYWEKSVNLGSELSVAYCELAKVSNKCKEHVDRINKLEHELSESRSKENKISTKIVEFDKDFARVNELLNKANNMENLYMESINERTELQSQLDEKSILQSEIDEQLHHLVARLAEREDEILSLKSDFDAIIQTNLSNSRQSKELGQEVVRLSEKIRLMEQKIRESEDARRKLEKSAKKEIGALRTRLSVFQENTEFLSLIFDSTESEQSEVEALKCKLAEKQRELDFFKKNRNTTIQRYENLVRQLQAALKVNSSASPSGRTRKHTVAKSNNNRHSIDEAPRRRSSACSFHEESLRSHDLDERGASSLLGANALTAYVYTTDGAGGGDSSETSASEHVLK